ncbi:putative cell wall protein [Hibiscus syriacus]|uniref:putative cell wall protein n=1 Tax=Hibiscus syriacus TaxID=106335 RepID=UPI001922795C|nr:putative cell wall protein [Hibiscus syriacus]
MASKPTSLLLAPIFLLGLVLAIAILQAVATRDIGRVMVPPVLEPQNPFCGSIGDSSGGSGYIPGGDDTFVPNPGFEVPIPGNGASIAAAATRPHP